MGVNNIKLCRHNTGEGFMAAIGILGGNSNETTVLLLRFCQDKGQRVIVGSYNLDGLNIIPFVAFDENEAKAKYLASKAPQIIILQDATNVDFVKAWRQENGYLLINTDNFNSSPLPPAKVITYGFNTRASVTASSVTEDNLQICVQRGFLSLSGQLQEPREFSAAFPAGSNPLNVLGAAAACVLCDV